MSPQLFLIVFIFCFHIIDEILLNNFCPKHPHHRRPVIPLKDFIVPLKYLSTCKHAFDFLVYSQEILQISLNFDSVQNWNSCYAFNVHVKKHILPNWFRGKNSFLFKLHKEQVFQ
jgi:hypothetical protein